MRVACIPVKVLLLLSSTTTILPAGTSPKGDLSVEKPTLPSQSSLAVRFTRRAHLEQFGL